VAVEQYTVTHKHPVAVEQYTVTHKKEIHRTTQLTIRKTQLITHGATHLTTNWECCMGTDGRTVRHKEADSYFSNFCEGTRKREKETNHLKKQRAD
jgi:hypothetical protein